MSQTTVNYSKNKKHCFYATDDKKHPLKVSMPV